MISTSEMPLSLPDLIEERSFLPTDVSCADEFECRGVRSAGSKRQHHHPIGCDVGGAGRLGGESDLP